MGIVRRLFCLQKVRLSCSCDGVAGLFWSYQLKFSLAWGQPCCHQALFQSISPGFLCKAKRQAVSSSDHPD